MTSIPRDTASRHCATARQPRDPAAPWAAHPPAGAAVHSTLRRWGRGWAVLRVKPALARPPNFSLLVTPGRRDDRGDLQRPPRQEGPRQVQVSGGAARGPSPRDVHVARATTARPHFLAPLQRRRHHRRPQEAHRSTDRCVASDLRDERCAPSVHLADLPPSRRCSPTSSCPPCRHEAGEDPPAEVVHGLQGPHHPGGLRDPRQHEP